MIHTGHWKVSRLAPFLLLTVGLVGGCKKAPTPAEAGSRAFASAAPELKAAWEEAVAADRTNGYATVTSILRRIRHPAALTPEQLQAINALYQSVSTRLSLALKQGDPEAKTAADVIARMEKDGSVTE